MKKLFEESVILPLISRAREVFLKKCSSSLFLAWGRSLKLKLKAWVRHSRLVAYIKRNGSIERYFEASFFYHLVTGAPSQAMTLLRGYYSLNRKAFEASLLCRPLYFLSNHLAKLASFSLMVFFLVPHELWSNQMSAFVALLLLTLLFVKTVTKPPTKPGVRVFDLFLSVFLLSVILARAFSIFPELSRRGFSYYLTCFAFLYVLIRSINTREELTSQINHLLLGTTLSGIYGLWQSIRGIPVIPYQIDIRLNEGMPGRVYSTFENSNNFAQILVMMIPFFLASLINAQSLKRRLFLMLALLPPVVALFLSLSRSGWIGLGISLLCFILLVRPALLPALVIPALILIPLLPDFILKRLSTITNPQDSSLDTRLNILKTMMPIVKDFWYTGTGLGSEVLTRLVRNYPLYTNTEPPHSHNLYLQLWLETGIIGLISFIGFLLRLIKKSLKAIYSKESDGAMRNFVIAGLSGLLGVLAIALIEYIWFYHRVMLIFWVLIGIILSALGLATLPSKEEG